MELNQKAFRQLLWLVGGGVLLNWGLQHLSGLVPTIGSVLGLITPFLVGGAIAFIFHVPMKRIESHLLTKAGPRLSKVRRPLAIVLTLVLMLCILTFAIFVILPGVRDTIKQISMQIPLATQAIERWIPLVEKRLPELGIILDDLQLDWESLAKRLMSMVQNLGSGLFSSGVSLVSGVVSGLVTFFIALVFSIYLLMQKEKLGRQCRALLYALLPERVVDRTVSIVRLSDKTFSSFLSGQCIESVILGSLFAVAMTLFRLPYAPLIGVLIAFTSLIPIVGAFIGCGVGAVLILMVSPLQALEFVILFLVLQQVEGNLIYPHVVGSSVGLPSIWVLAAVTLGGKLMGVLGMLLFIPLCSVAYALLREFAYHRLAQRGVPREKWSDTAPPAPPKTRRRKP